MTSESSNFVVSAPWYRQPGLGALVLAGVSLLVAALVWGGMLIPIAAFGLMLILLGTLFAGGSGWRPTSTGWLRISRGARMGLLSLSLLALVGLLVLQQVGRQEGPTSRFTADRGGGSDNPVWVPPPVIDVASSPSEGETFAYVPGEIPEAADTAEANDVPRNDAVSLRAQVTPSPTPTTRHPTAVTTSSAARPAAVPAASSSRARPSKARLAPGEVCVCDVTGTPNEGIHWTSSRGGTTHTTIRNALGAYQYSERLRLTLDDGRQHDLSVSPQHPHRQTTLSLGQPSAYSLEADLTWHDGSRFSLSGSGLIDPRQARDWQVSLLQDGGIPYALRLDPLP